VVGIALVRLISMIRSYLYFAKSLNVLDDYAGQPYEKHLCAHTRLSLL
jgi:hypothetical protein